MTTPGRPKGTKVTVCDACGRRVAGAPGQTVKCPDCGVAVKVPTVTKRKTGKRTLVFLIAKK